MATCCQHVFDHVFAERVYQKHIMRVQHVVLIGIKRILFNFACNDGELVSDLVCLLFKTGDLEPAVLAVVGELGLALRAWSRGVRGGELGVELTNPMPVRSSMTCRTTLGL
jgi:hypothetical protein